MTQTNAAPKLKSFAELSGSAPGKVQVPTIGMDGAITGKSEDLDTLYLPDPVGHFMLIALPDVEAKTAKGIIIPETVTDRERAASVVGTVIAMGPDCYIDPEPVIPLAATATGMSVTMVVARPRFPSGPWCKPGDTVLFSRYAGKRFKSGGIEFRMLNDDEITATIPEGAKVGGL